MNELMNEWMNEWMNELINYTNFSSGELSDYT